jgi:hypothetical protein
MYIYVGPAAAAASSSNLNATVSGEMGEMGIVGIKKNLKGSGIYLHFCTYYMYSYVYAIFILYFEDKICWKHNTIIYCPTRGAFKTFRSGL